MKIRGSQDKSKEKRRSSIIGTLITGILIRAEGTYPGALRRKRGMYPTAIPYENERYPDRSAAGFVHYIFRLNLLQVVIVSRSTRSSVEADSKVDYQETVTGYVRSIENDVNTFLARLDYYVSADVMQTGDFDAAGAWLTAHEKNRHKDFEYIMLIDKSGLAYNDIGTRTDVSQRDYFREVVFGGKDFFIDNPVLSKTSGNYVVHFSRAVKVNGSTFAAVVGVVPISIITQERNEIKFGKQIDQFKV